MPLVQVAVLSDGKRVLIEVLDQAPGKPILKQVNTYAEAGRGACSRSMR